MTWSVWIQSCWRNYAENHQDQRIVLSTWQRRLVWGDLIQTDMNQYQQNFLWNQQASISQAINAWQLCHEYEFEPATWHHSNDDVEVFRRWYQQYSTTLKANQWLDSAQLINIMVMNGYSPDFDQLVFVKRRFTPNQHKWLTHIQHLDQTDIEFLTAQSASDSDAQVSVYANFDQEIKACAKWARKQIKQNSNQIIAIVVPELRTQAQTVRAVFRSVFTPNFDVAEDETELFELPSVHSIKQSGFVNSAFNCLELLRDKFEFETFSLFLRDMNFKDASEYSHQYSLWDIELRKLAGPEESLPGLIRLCKKLAKQHSIDGGNLLRRLEQLQALRDSMDRRASSIDWCNTFSTALNYLGWPDPTNLSPENQYQLKQWNQILAQFSTGGLVKKRLSLSQALGFLNELAAGISLRSNHQAPIKIIALEDVSQAYFDLAWISGLNDSVLPTKTQLNPLLPISLQRKHGIPFSSNESCLEQAQSIYGDMTMLAEKIRFSYYKSDEFSDFRVSPLIRHLQQKDNNDLTETEFVQTPNLQLDQYQDEVGLPLNNNSIAGGTYLLKTQSACPFQAYASYRLKAEPLQFPRSGLDAAEKGLLVHDVLRRIWQELATQQVLISLSEDELAELVNKHIDQSLKRLNALQPLFSQIEKFRLFELVSSWLEIERSRQTPFSVLKQEHRSFFDINEFSVEIKIDRIDELENGRWLILDYKSGNADSNHWIRDIDRIEDPQLPVYFLANKEKAGAIAFANLKETKFDGIADGDIGVTGVVDVNKSNRKFLKQIKNWGELTQLWLNSVQTLTQEYTQGRASVTPRDSVSQCQYCQRHSLCRLYQQQTFVSDDDPAS